MDEARYRAAEQALWASVGASTGERFLDLPGAGLRLRVQELGDGPPILFIHGANTSGASWATLAAKLPAFRCLLLDRPGTGLRAPWRAGRDPPRAGRRRLHPARHGARFADTERRSLAGHLAQRRTCARHEVRQGS